VLGTVASIQLQARTRTGIHVVIALYAHSIRSLQCRCALLRPLQVLREDFCGTAALLHRFVTEDDVDDSTRLGLGVDIDPEVIEWGRRRRTFGPRTLLLAADVFDAPKTFLGSRPDAVSFPDSSFGGVGGVGYGTMSVVPRNGHLAVSWHCIRADPLHTSQPDLLD
jgi:hypothetical protein